MGILDSFKKVNLNNAGPLMTISPYGLTFNKTVVETMSFPNFVILFFDEGEKRIAIQTSQDKSDIPFCANKSNKINARINNKEFARKIYKMMNWNFSDGSYRVPGIWYSDENVFIFDIKEAEMNASNDKEDSAI